MAKTYANIIAQYVTFAGWLDRTNSLSYDMSTVVVTTAANTVGATTNGNTYINGILSANTLVATQGIRGGTVATSANLVLGSILDFSTQGLRANNSLGTAGFVLTSNGTSVYWDVPRGVQGSNTQVMFNDSGVANGSAGFTFNKATTNLSIANNISAKFLTISGATSTFSSNISIGTAAGLIANGSIGAAGQILTSNGSTVYWASVSTSAAGSNTNILFNDSGSPSGSDALTFNKTTNTVNITNSINVTNSVRVGTGATNTVIQSSNSFLYAPFIRGAVEAVLTVPAATGTVNIDLSYNIHRWTMTGNVTSITFSNAPANNIAISGTLYIQRDASANSTNRVITFPTANPGKTLWAGGSAPPQTGAANAVDVYQFFSVDGGNNYIWSMAVKDAK